MLNMNYKIINLMFPDLEIYDLISKLTKNNIEPNYLKIIYVRN